MKKLLSMLLAAGCYSAAATQWYVSTNGLPTNAGTLASPWDLGTSMTNAPVAGGDTVWIQPGTYPGTYAITLSGSSSNAPIIYRNYQYGLVKLVGPAWSSDNFTTVNANELSLLNSNIWVWGLDVSYAPTNRMNATTSASPTWLLGSGIDLLGAANCKVINCIVHDALDGITAWSSDACAEITGNLVYNIGMEGADRGHGHNIYVQNGVSPSDTTRKVIRNNVSFNGFDANFHAYTQGSYVNNMDVTNNVFFNGGIYYTNYNAYVFEGGNLVMGGFTGHGVVGGNVSGNVFVNGNADFGYDGATNGRLTFNNNWSISNVVNVVYFSNLTAMGNASLPTINQAQYRVAGLPASYLINSNIYWSAQGTPAYGADLYGGQTVPFQDWRTNGWDLNSYCYATLPTTNWVWTSPNPYDANICYVAIVNWLSNSTVTAALPGLLASGASYTVQNVQNYYGAPVATGVYSGSITFPMTNLSVAAPVAWTSCPPIGPFFGAFVVTASSTNNGAVLNLVTMSDLNTALAAAQSAGATNAISNTNGVGYGLTVLDGVRATNFIGNANGLTNLNGSTIQFATIGPKACGFSIVTNTATNIVLAGVFSGDGSGLSNVLASIGQAGTLSNANTTITASGIASAQATVTNLTFQGATMVDTNNNPVFAVRGSVTLANQFIGLDGGKFNTTGYDDVANGFEAMGRVTTGHDNEANGWYALGFSTNGNYNTANGSSALMYDYSGNGSTAEGYQALMYASNHFNTAMGAYAMVNASNAVGCVALGVQAGQGNISNEWSLADQYCGWLGFSASRDPSLPISTALTNAWALGYTATVSNNNTLSIGGPAQPMTLLAAKIISTNFTGNGAGLTNVTATVSPNGYTLTNTLGTETWIDFVRDFGGVGDGVTDNSSNLQAAINFAMLGANNQSPSAPNWNTNTTGIIYFRPGKYAITNVPFGTWNSQIYIPFKTNAMSCSIIKLVAQPDTGFYPGSLTGGRYSEFPVRIFSTVTNAGCLFCLTNYFTNNVFPCVKFEAVGIQFSSLTNSWITPLELNGMEHVLLRDCSIASYYGDATIGAVNLPQPQAGTIGVELPDQNCGDDIKMEHVQISGYETGLKFSEHFHGYDLHVQGCVSCIVTKATAQNDNCINGIVMEDYKYGLNFNAACAINIIGADFERAASGAWYTTVYDVYDPSIGYALGSMTYGGYDRTVSQQISSLMFNASGGGEAFRTKLQKDPWQDVSTSVAANPYQRGPYFQHFGGGYGSGMSIAHARGTPSSATIVNSGDGSTYQIGAYDGSAWQFPIVLQGLANGSMSAGSIPMDFVLYTSNSTANISERLRVDSAGKVNIQKTLNLGQLLTLTNSLTIRSNTAALAIPSAPTQNGDCFVWNSNGYPYMILSTNGSGGGSSSWTGTNKLGW